MQACLCRLLVLACALLANPAMVRADLLVTPDSASKSVPEGSPVAFTVTVKNSFNATVTVTNIQIGIPHFVSGDEGDKLQQPVIVDDNIRPPPAQGGTNGLIGSGGSGTFGIFASTINDGAPFNDGNGLWDFDVSVSYKVNSLEDSKLLKLTVEVLDPEPSCIGLAALVPLFLCRRRATADSPRLSPATHDRPQGD